VYICCKEHLELAIDHFVDNYEDAPDVYNLDDVTFTAWKAPNCCEFCQNESQFLVL